jgi:hypothetical protein
VCNPFCHYKKLDTEYRVRHASGAGGIFEGAGSSMSQIHNQPILFLTLALFAVGGCSSNEGESTTHQVLVDGAKVTCGLADGSGDAVGDDTTEISCEQEFSDCDDGRVYSVSCKSVVGSGSSLCTCSVDGLKSAAFELPDECPVQENDVLDGCEWE